MWVEASPFKDRLLNYDPNGGLEFAQYAADEHGGEEFKQLAAESVADQQDENPDAITKPTFADD
ncbi:hypothetical protein [Halalkalicoccus paucihalophilus]|nr:hypothetical protein [Halalkalicoccus paucihalophilus]